MQGYEDLIDLLTITKRSNASINNFSIFLTSLYHKEFTRMIKIENMKVAGVENDDRIMGVPKFSQ